MSGPIFGQSHTALLVFRLAHFSQTSWLNYSILCLLFYISMSFRKKKTVFCKILKSKPVVWQCLKKQCLIEHWRNVKLDCNYNSLWMCEVSPQCRHNLHNLLIIFWQLCARKNVSRRGKVDQLVTVIHTCAGRCYIMRQMPQSQGHAITQSFALRCSNIDISPWCSVIFNVKIWFYNLKIIWDTCRAARSPLVLLFHLISLPEMAAHVDKSIRHIKESYSIRYTSRNFNAVLVTCQ
jgi:hypothetical protein